MSAAERIVRNDEVVGSIPTSSTIFSTAYAAALIHPFLYCLEYFGVAHTVCF